MENPFELFNKRLEAIEGRQTEILALLKASPANPANLVENPICADDAAKLFGITKQTLYHNKRRLNSKKRFGRLYFNPADIRAFTNSGTV